MCSKDWMPFRCRITYLFLTPWAFVLPENIRTCLTLSCNHDIITDLQVQGTAQRFKKCWKNQARKANFKCFKPSRLEWLHCADVFGLWTVGDINKHDALKFWWLEETSLSYLKIIPWHETHSCLIISEKFLYPDIKPLHWCSNPNQTQSDRIKN